jgi:peptide/nickel transport system substrate-binding protein
MPQRWLGAVATAVLLPLVVVGCAPRSPESARTAPAPAQQATGGAPNAAGGQEAAGQAGGSVVNPGSSGQAAPAAAAPAGEPKRGGTLVFGNSKDVTTPHPYVATSSIPRYIKESMYEPLIARDTEFNVHGHLAERWEHNADASVWTFKLRERVKFHNGKEMTAEDVVWSTNYIMDPENGAYGQSVLADNLARVEAPDKYTVRFTLKGARPLFYVIVADIGRLSVIPAESLRRGETQLQGAPPPGTGPFKFEAFVPADHTTVVRFDDYWGGAAYLDRIVFKVIARETARGNALRAGDVQMAERLPVELVLRVREGKVSGIQLQPAGLSGYRVLGFNHTSRWFQDKRMREAVALSIDQKAYMDEVTFGLGVSPGAAVVPGSAWEKAMNVPARQRNLDRAKQLLREAGYNGEPVTLIAERGQGEPIVESLSRMIREAGVNVQVQTLESGVYDERQMKGDFDLTPAGHSAEIEPGLNLDENYRCETGPTRKSNKIGYCNPELNKLLDQYHAEADRTKRIDLHARGIRMVYDDVAEVHLGYHRDRFFGYLDKVQGFSQDGGGGYFHAKGGLHRTWMEQ